MKRKRIKEQRRDVRYGKFDRPGPQIDGNNTMVPEYPIAPLSVSPQMATQFTVNEPPVEDENFLPSTVEELSHALSALARKVDIEDIKPCYLKIKKFINKNYSHSNKITESQLRKMIQVILKENFEQQTFVLGDIAITQIPTEEISKYPIILRALNSFGIDTKVAKPGYPFRFYKSTLDFYAGDKQGNFAKIASYDPKNSLGPDYYGDFFKGKKLTAKEAVKELWSFNTEEQVDPSMLKNIKQMAGFEYESGMRQFINRLSERLHLLRFIYKANYTEINKDKIMNYFYNKMQSIFSGSKLVGKLQDENHAIHQQVFASIAKKVYHQNIAPLVNKELKNLEKEGIIVANNRVKGKIPPGTRTTFENEFRKMLRGEDLNVKLIAKTFDDPVTIIKTMAEVAESILEELNEEKLAQKYWQAIKNYIDQLTHIEVLNALVEGRAEEGFKMGFAKERKSDFTDWIAATDFLKQK
jgi:hypothetical protein